LGLILFLLLLLGIALTFLISTERTQQNDLVKLTTNQYQLSFETLLENSSARYKQQVYDYTYWDDFCRFMNTKEEGWSDENLATIIQNYDLDDVLVLTSDNRLFYTYPNDSTQMPLLVDRVRSLTKDLYRKRIINTYFFEESSGQAGMIYAATIHPTNDIQRLTKPQGYFFLVKYWDRNYLKELERISGSELSVETVQSPIAFDNENVTFYKELTGYDGKSTAFLRIVRPAPYLKLNRDFSDNVFLIYLLSAVLLIVIILTSLYFLIGKPLGLLGSILAGEKSLLPRLKTYGGEYVQIADIVEQSNSIQEQLEKAKVRAEESDRLKSAFLANISHEIRTPMNAIMGFSKVLPEQFDNKEELKACTDIIAERSQDLLDIVNSMIDMSRLNTGNVLIQTKICDLPLLFGELKSQFESIRYRSGNKNIVFEVRIEIEERNCQIVTDFAKLKEIFVHLLSNAFKFTEKGSVVMGCRRDPVKGIVFYVSDTGCGIPQDQQARIFNYFTRLNNELTDNVSGTGLGLAIVKGLIDLLEGSIWLESVPGKGSTFWFSIPVQNESKPIVPQMYL
jgi:signal transduction histidine kinase